eukprot:TRINITY_DN2686_c0_g1_i1.p1 TRINITY_DN2686_c0_g1~~TRINITY_DN2686_c0_g1_i1.p1  ORF type:complete len:266 (+),score=69.70 TRINITY_DN2686_c0_g1_i1:981-1778(+)
MSGYPPEGYVPYFPEGYGQTALGGPHLGTDEVLSENTLYVRNFPTTVTTDEIKAAFSKFGPIEDLRLQTNKETGQFFGSVFIEYIHPSAARLARLQMDKKPFQEKILYIEFAKEKKFPKSNKVRSSPTPSPSLYISGLKSDDPGYTKSIFSRFGEIVALRYLNNVKGIAFIDFELEESATAAIDQLNNTTFDGGLLKVAYSVKPSKPKRLSIGGESEYPSKKPRIESEPSSSPFPVDYAAYDPSTGSVAPDAALYGVPTPGTNYF